MAITKIKKRSGKIVDFEKNKITEAIWKAAQAVGGKDKELAEQLSDEVVDVLNKKYPDQLITVEDVQDTVEKVLIEEGHAKTSKAYILYRQQHKEIRDLKSMLSKVSVVDDYLDENDWRVKENSNMTYSLQGLNFHISSKIISNYWLDKIYPNEIKQTHNNGDFHIHDLGIFGSYCVGWDLQDLLISGFKGVRGKIEAKPAKHFRVALGQIINFFYTLQGEAAGAQAFSNFDTLLAPFIRYDNLTYKQVKQSIQEFMFNINVPTRVGFQCMSEDTEILTPEGWKKYDEIEKGDTIKTFNLEKKIIEDQKVNNVFRKKYSGTMYNLKNKIQDQLISPEHRVVRRKNQTGEYILEPIEDVMKMKSPFMIPIAAGNKTKPAKISDEQIKLMAWIISEGSVGKPGKNKSSHKISICQSKKNNPKNYKEIKNLLKKLNLEYSEYTSTGLDDENKIKLNTKSSKKIHSWFKTNESVNFIPDILLSMDERQSKLFLETYIKGDGFEGCKISTTSREILDSLQIICVNAGYGFTVLKRKSTIKTKDIFVLRIIKNKETYIQKVKKVKYNGIIWCPNTKNETVIARRNGKVFITGNTPFTNITMDLTVPSYLKDQSVIIGGNPQKEKYGDFQEEMDMFNKAFAEVMLQGDAKGRVFTFPIPTYNITKDFDWSNPKYDLIWEMTAKYGIPYFCLDKNTELITDHGIKKICDVKKTDKVLGDNGKFIKILMKNKRISDKNIILYGNNYKIICSDNHKFLTKKGLKMAGNLSLNDELMKYDERIVFENGMYLDNYSKNFFKTDNLSNIKNEKFIELIPNKKIKKPLKFEYQKNRFQTTLKDIKIPNDLNETLMELIGIIIGDGYLKKNVLKITNADKEILNFVKKTIKKEFNIKTMETKAGKSKICKELSSNSAILLSFLEHIGINGNCYTKRIPEICFFRSEKEIGSLLRGMFDTDGNVTLNNKKDHIISISFANKELMNDTLLLLAKIGIIGKLNKLRNGKRIVITGERNINLFKEKIGFRIKRKNTLLSSLSISNPKPSIGDEIVSLKDAVNIDKHYKYQNKEFVRIKSNKKEPYLFVSGYQKKSIPMKINKIEIEEKRRTLYDITIDSKKHLFVLKNGIISHNSNFINSDMKPEDARSMCCRLRIDNKELRKRGGGLFGANPLTGSVGVVTINMPRIGYLSKTEEEFFERLDNLMDLAKESLEIKRKVIEGFTERGLYPYSKYYLRSVKEKEGKYWQNHFSTIGLVGMNEALLNFLKEDITSEKGISFAEKVLEHMRDRMREYQEETGHMYNLEATPAEGTSFRLAKKDKEKYPDIVAANEENQRNGKPAYYTNSSQLPVGYTSDLFEALDLQDRLQTKYTGGTVLHGFVGEKMPSPESTKRLVRKIAENYRIPYFTVTPTFSICPIHGYIQGEHEFCPICENEGGDDDEN